MRINPEIIKTRLAPLVGKRAWGASLGVGSFITLEFGSKIKAAGGYVHGDWHLWIYCCAWRIERGSRVLVASEDNRLLIKKIIKTLNGRQFADFTITSSLMDTSFAFEGDLVLKTFGVYSRDVEQWMLFTPERKVLTVGPGAKASYKPAAEPTVSPK